jgi:hypothetical protein
MVLHPKDPEWLFQQNHQGVFRSTNCGKNWERIENGIPNSFGLPMFMLPKDSNTLYIVPQESDEFRIVSNGRPTVYRTVNGGDSWEPLRTGLPKDAYDGVLRQAMAADSCDSPGVYSVRRVDKSSIHATQVKSGTRFSARCRESAA